MKINTDIDKERRQAKRLNHVFRIFIDGREFRGTNISPQGFGFCGPNLKGDDFYFLHHQRFKNCLV